MASSDSDDRPSVTAALAAAERLCADRGARLTARRRRVLELLWELGGSAGAYDLLERLAAEGVRTHPPTVYRALDFLVSQRLAHKAPGGHGFVACRRPTAPHAPQFVICQRCDSAEELFDDRLTGAFAAIAAERGLDAEACSAEILGVCAECRTGPAPSSARR